MEIKHLNISQIIDLEKEYVVIVVFGKNEEVLFDNFMKEYYKNNPTVKIESPITYKPDSITLAIIDRLPSNERYNKVTNLRLNNYTDFRIGGYTEVTKFLTNPNNIIIENRKNRLDVKYIATIASKQTLEIEDILDFLFGGDNND